MNEVLSITHKSLIVPTRYGNTYVLASGPKDAPPLILLPALGVTSSMWQPNLAALNREHLTYAVDTLGDLGKSVLYNQDEYLRNGQAYSDWLVEIFNEFGIEQADIIGSSMGGWIAMNYAIHAPERVKRMVLLGPMGLPSWWTTLKVMSYLWSIFLFPTRSNIDRITCWALGDDPKVREAYAGFMRIGAKNWKSLRAAPPLNLSNDQLRRIKAPTLLILGERDNVIGNAKEVGDRANQLISNVRVEIISDAGHMMNTEKPEFVNARIVRFLRESNLQI